MKYLLIFILSIPNVLNSQIITDHNLEWTLNNNPLFAKTTYELKLRYDYVMDKSKGDTITKLSFDIKEVNETVGGKINSENLNASGLLSRNVSLLGGLLGGSISSTEVVNLNSKSSKYSLFNNQIDTLITYINQIDTFSYYSDIFNRSIIYNIGDLFFGVMVTKDYGGKNKKIQNLNIEKNFFLKIGETNFIFNVIDFIEFKKSVLPLIIKSKNYFVTNKAIKNIDDFK